MTLAQLIPLAIQASMALLIFSVGLGARLENLTYLLHRPRLLLRSLIVMNVIMPLLAVAMALLFDLNKIVELALVAYALAPVPPILPKKESQGRRRVFVRHRPACRHRGGGHRLRAGGCGPARPRL